MRIQHSTHRLSYVSAVIVMASAPILCKTWSFITFFNFVPRLDIDQYFQSQEM